MSTSKPLTFGELVVGGRRAEWKEATPNDQYTVVLLAASGILRAARLSASPEDLGSKLEELNDLLDQAIALKAMGWEWPEE